jgi:deoxyhypusine synthase
MKQGGHRFYGDRILPEARVGGGRVADLIDSSFLAYNAGKLQRACRLFASDPRRRRHGGVEPSSGALTPAGLGRSCLIPLIRLASRRLDHLDRREPLPRRALRPRLALHRGSEQLDDVELRRVGVIRIYDVRSTTTCCCRPTPTFAR